MKTIKVLKTNDITKLTGLTPVGECVVREITPDYEGDHAFATEYECITYDATRLLSHFERMFARYGAKFDAKNFTNGCHSIRTLTSELARTYSDLGFARCHAVVLELAAQGIKRPYVTDPEEDEEQWRLDCVKVKAYRVIFDEIYNRMRFTI